MATAKQISANQRNAHLSTGPRTDRGKAAARGNALRHGLAATVVVPGEEMVLNVSQACDNADVGRCEGLLLCSFWDIAGR